MLSRKGAILCLLIVVLLPISCTKIDQMTGTGTGLLTIEKLPDGGSIPADYGNLISVSSVKQLPTVVQLWFQNEDGDIRMVRYSFKYDQFLKIAYFIPRK